VESIKKGGGKEKVRKGRGRGGRGIMHLQTAVSETFRGGVKTNIKKNHQQKKKRRNRKEIILLKHTL